MAKIIVTSRYLKKGSGKSVSNYVKYIATRKGAVNTQERENYVGYLANRPGAVKYGVHGLFSQTDTPIDLNAAAKEIAEHPGHIWTHVVSLRREDAQRMGYDTLDAWRDLVKRQMPNISRQSKISLQNLRWYTAFHDKETNPHVHIVVYSTDPREGFLTKKGIEKIRSGFANDIYSDELHHLYAQQMDIRNMLKKNSSDLMKSLLNELRNSGSENIQIQSLIQKLYQQLAQSRGRKMYGYLKPDVRQTVDDIFLILSQQEIIRKLYAQWCEMEQAKHDVYSSAKVRFPVLIDNPQFRSIKNTIIKIVTEMDLAPVTGVEEQDLHAQQNAKTAQTAFGSIVPAFQKL